MTPIVSLLVGVVVVFAITAATAYFVAQEFAYVAVDRSRLASRASAGDQRAEATLTITRRTSFMLSGAQLGITVTGLLVGYVAEPLIGQAFASLVTGGTSTAISVTIGGIVALAFSTLVQMLFGELFPKNYAIARSAQTADALTPSTRIYLTVLGPVIWVFDKAAELLLRALRIEPVHDVEATASATDLERVVALSRDAGTLAPTLAVVIDRILDFPRRDVQHAMVPRVGVDTVRDTVTVAEVRALMATGHTRYPVLDAGERVVGVVDLVDVLGVPADADLSVTRITREALVVPVFMPLPDAQAALADAHAEIACVVDEFGAFVGIVTVEDLVEEIIGDIADEHDPVEADASPGAPEGPWEVAGDVHVDEVERSTGLTLPEGDFQTIAGLVIREFGDLPEVGQSVTLRLEPTPAQLALHPDTPPRHVTLEVLEVARHVPGRVLISLAEDGAATEGPAADGGA
ncbi:hemolysin family protein [Propioniciclava soli]|uniref:Hemolysin family protein n=1 Tax=Propioniciclava soli TaxID=2775081 RepID=A0ABZ3CAN2_9ACTN|nr:hemolysin family protein [Propioniciclava soli]